jgi:AcrR family transcriptional regulator
MPRQPPTKPRKYARQERSRATVDALVEATARILSREGFESASTNRIAEEAGVSIGSLYQYFPCKEALVAAVLDRHNQRLMEVARGTLPRIDTLPLEEAVRAIVTVGIDAHRVNPRLHRVLTEQMPRSAQLMGRASFSREIQGLFRTFLERHLDEIRPLDLDLAAFLCVTSIEAVTHTAVLHRPDVLTGESATALVEEATRLIVGYLKPC